MKYHILTLFPEMIEQGLHTSILGRAINNGYISLETTNIRDFSANKFNRVDDYPYGGGAGMVMEAEPVFRAYQSVAEKIGKKPRTVYLTPQGKVLNQTMVEELALEDDLVLLCGHYEGIDDRVLQEVVTDYISIGDYVLTGGELGAMVLVDAVSRFVPGVLSNEESSQFESLQDNLLEYPHYTRPETWHEKKVPEVLLSGDHKKIEAWRHEASLVRTAERRPDLLENAFQISCACNEKEESSAWAHDLLAGMTRYGVSLDLGRKKIRKQKNLFDDHDLLILQLPGTLEEGMKAKSEYIRSFAGKETPLVFLCPDGFSEEEEKLEEQLEKNGFRLVARLTGIPSADGLQRFSFALRSLLYSGEWKVKKYLHLRMHYSIIYLVVSKEMVRCCKKALRTSRVKKGDKEMNDIIKKIEDAQLKAEAPEFRVGDTVKVYGKIKEGNRERIQVFEGVVLKRQGGGSKETFTVRKSSNGVGVEKIWPVHSPNVEKVEVIRRGKVRRAKLNYLRDRVGKAAKVKELVK